MKRFFNSLVRAFLPSRQVRPVAAPRRTSLGLEALEGRALMSASPLLAATTVHYPTDPCMVTAAHYPTDPCIVSAVRPGAQVTLNPQPLPPAKATIVAAHPGDQVTLNPQPLPPGNVSHLIVHVF